MLCESTRTQVAYYMRRLYQHGLTTSSGGNISCRTPEGHIAITASKFDKGELTAEGVCVVTPDRQLLTRKLPLSIETGMHLSIYAKRPDIQAIVHAHPVTATAFCASGVKLDTRLTAEAYAILGNPVFVPYELMGSSSLAARVSEAMVNADCCLMENHGILTVGKNLLDAFDKIELLEFTAKQTLIVSQLGDVRRLDDAKIAELDRFVGRK
ncbi:MAG: class II aldolase/adducin family protein [Lentisphaerae bacterium]|jgi:L-fuculose-phosphate aldolase|nr:class II aldolase/adducin family protein [Lentisphaerota bacterium]